VQEQEATNAELKRGMDAVIARLNEQDSKIHNTSAQLEMTKPAPQRLSSNR
jgi:hypothetical protein